MSVWQAAGVALLGAAAVLLLREMHASLAPAARLAATLVLLGGAAALLLPPVLRIRALLDLTDGAEYALPLLRAAGIGLICEFCASFCRDLGENTLADGVLFFGRAEVLLLCLPLVDKILEIAKELLNF